MYNLKFSSINNSAILNEEQKAATDKVAQIFQSNNISEIAPQKSIFGDNRVRVVIKFSKPIMTDGALSLGANSILALSQLKVLNRIQFNEKEIELSL